MAAEAGLRFLPAASAELVEAAARYEREQRGLGIRFVAAIDHALLAIGKAPERWPFAPRVPLRLKARRYLLKRFPYSVIYRTVEGEQLEVLAVAHQRRRPGYWVRR